MKVDELRELNRLQTFARGFDSLHQGGLAGCAGHAPVCRPAGCTDRDNSRCADRPERGLRRLTGRQPAVTEDERQAGG